MPLFFDWRNASQPDDLVRPIVAALRDGGLVAMPSASGYLIAANAAHPEALDRLTAGPAGAPASYAIVVGAVGEAERWTGPLPRAVERMANRLWPGPMTLILPTRIESSSGSLGNKWAPNGRLRFRSPRHLAVDAMRLAADFPLIAREITHADGIEEAVGPLVEGWGDALAAIVDDGPIVGKTATEVLVDESGWRVEREGAIPQTEVVAAAAQWIVFLCTGNTCRSPMAEALCKTLLSSRLGCAIDELPARGYRIFSAGVSASAGDGPAAEAVDVLRDFGADLDSHRSQALAMETVAHADHLIGMTRSHLLIVLSRYPVIGGAMRLLCGAEGDLDDPIGGGREVYDACARSILRHLDRFLMELVRR